MGGDLRLDDADESVERDVLRAAFMRAEARYWAAAEVVHEARLPPASSDVTVVACPPQGTLCAGGTKGGAVVVWQLAPGGGGPAILLARGGGETRGSDVMQLTWSSDATELLAIDAAGHVRLYSLYDPAPHTCLITTTRAADYWEATADVQRGAPSSQLVSAALELPEDDEDDIVGAARSSSIGSRRGSTVSALGGNGTEASVLRTDAERAKADHVLARRLAAVAREAAVAGGAGDDDNLAAALSMAMRNDSRSGAPLSLPIKLRLQLKASPQQLVRDDDAGDAASSEPALVGTFHPAFTLLGTQPCVVVGTLGGPLVKINRPGAERVFHSAPLLPRAGAMPKPLVPPPQTAAAAAAAAEAAEPPRGAAAAAARADRRRPVAAGASKDADDAAFAQWAISKEYFVGHQAPVLAVSFVENSSLMSTIAEDGVVILWRYSADAYSARGYYRPSRSARISKYMRALLTDPTTVQVHFPPPGVPVPSVNTDGELPRSFVRVSSRYAALRVAPLRLPCLPFRVVTLEEPVGAERRTYGSLTAPLYGEPVEMNSLTRDSRGVLLRHTSALYRWHELEGRLEAAAATSDARHLGILMHFDLGETGNAKAAKSPPGMLRLCLLSLRTLNWEGVQVTVPLSESPRAKPLLCIGPVADIPATDYAFVGVDASIRIYSLGSGAQVRVLRASAAPLRSLCVSADGAKVIATAGSGARPDFWELVMPHGKDSPERSHLIATRLGSSRARAVPSEQREREQHWVLGTDSLGKPLHGVYTRTYVRRFVQALVELSMREVEHTNRRNRSRASIAEGTLPRLGANSMKSPKAVRRSVI